MRDSPGSRYLVKGKCTLRLSTPTKEAMSLSRGSLDGRTRPKVYLPDTCMTAKACGARTGGHEFVSDHGAVELSRCLKLRG